MEKMLKFLEEVGAAGGAGAFLLLASWGLLVIDLIDFKPSNLAGLPTAQLIASLAGSLGLLLLLFRLKQATREEGKRTTANAEDRACWERFASFIKDRRALTTLRDYEHLPYMLESIDAIRNYLRAELQSLAGRAQIREDFETLQEACRDFASSCDVIWPDRQVMPSHLIDVPSVDIWRFCTAVGVLRGQIAAMLKARDIANTKALISGLVGGRDH
jgi:hypothetical protein